MKFLNYLRKGFAISSGFIYGLITMPFHILEAIVKKNDDYVNKEHQTIIGGTLKRMLFSLASPYTAAKVFYAEEVARQALPASKSPFKDFGKKIGGYFLGAILSPFVALGFIYYSIIKPNDMREKSFLSRLFSIPRRIIAFLWMGPSMVATLAEKSTSDQREIKKGFSETAANIYQQFGINHSIINNNLTVKTQHPSTSPNLGEPGTQIPTPDLNVRFSYRG